MDFITHKFKQKIDVYKANDNSNELNLYYRVNIEYYLVLILAFLWNKNIHLAENEVKEQLYKKIIRPSIGTLLEMIRLLDTKEEILNSIKIDKTLNKYPNLRNEYLGHGYVFEDKIDDVSEIFRMLLKDIEILECKTITEKIDFIIINEFKNSNYKGIRIKSDLSICPFSCNEKSFQFNSCETYIELNNEYFRVSPFIDCKNEDNIYVFQSINEKLLGKVRYNKIFITGTFYREWKEFKEIYFENNGIVKVSFNRTIMNEFENNFKNYIDLGIKNKIKKFLIFNRSSVCATIWGQGGVGKTATIQSLCNDFFNDEKKYFDYIIFVTRKDRNYNYFNGEIFEVKPSIDTYQEIINNVNTIIGSESFEINSILNYTGKILLVIDDFETFALEERKRIQDFIKSLNVNNHKVVITTRMNLIVGEEIQTNELSEDESIRFLKEILNVDLNIPLKSRIIEELNEESIKKSIHDNTLGRPLFIFQLAHIIAQKGSVSDIINLNVSQSEKAIEFIYGRIYNNLTRLAQSIFECISLIVSQEDLTNLTEKLQYLLNEEDDEYSFNIAIKELEKLKIIKIDEENKFFEVYSKEILQIMKYYFEKRDEKWRGARITRLMQINRDKNLNTDQSLLLAANQNRLSKNEEEVIAGYKQILNRVSSSEKIKLNAILNLAAYLIDRGKRSDALSILNEKMNEFKNNPNFTKMYANYYWGNGIAKEKNKAIEMLANYLSSSKELDLGINSELLGQFILYKCVFYLNEWHDINYKLKLRELDKTNLKIKQGTIYKEFQYIFDPGLKLFSFVEKNKLDDFTTASKTNIISGLYQFISICEILKQFDLISRICNYMLYYAPKHFHFQFKRIQERSNLKNYNFKRIHV